MEENITWLNLQKGDERSFKKLFDLYYKPICIYLLQYTRDLHDAEDIVQGVFVELWEKRKKIKITQSLKSYLYKASYNSFIDKTRRDKRNDAFLDTLKYKSMQMTSEEDRESYQERITKIQELVQLLPERCKEILILSKRNGLKYSEIADELNISIKTVEAQMRLAFQKIREGFKDDELFLFLINKAICSL